MNAFPKMTKKVMLTSLQLARIQCAVFDELKKEERITEDQIEAISLFSSRLHKRCFSLPEVRDDFSPAVKQAGDIAAREYEKKNKEEGEAVINKNVNLEGFKKICSEGGRRLHSCPGCGGLIAVQYYSRYGIRLLCNNGCNILTLKRKDYKRAAKTEEEFVWMAVDMWNEGKVDQ